MWYVFLFLRNFVILQFMKKGLLVLFLIILLPACKNVKKGDVTVQSARRSFPVVAVPMVVTGEGQRLDYITTHYWDAFFSGAGETGPDAVLGVANEELEKSISAFIIFLDELPMAKAQEKVSHFFRQLEDYQSRDTAGNVYLLMTEKVARYMYDPNSPMRNEDYYLPFVSGMVESEYTRDDVRAGYRYEKEMCSMNRYGETAPDFVFADAAGARHTLHGVRADNTLLFFSNPGCHNCLEIMEILEASPLVNMLVSQHRLAVVNVYIDRDLDKWRDYVHNYPAEWLCGYDPNFILRDNELYNIRAIPSLYLLDRDKKVIYKDVPVEKVIDYLGRNR